MVPRMRRQALLLTLAVIAAGCATGPKPIPTASETPAAAAARRAHASRPTYNLADYPPAVREGYIDGCESAKHSEWARKDAKRFADDGQYAMGWNDGFRICKKK